MVAALRACSAMVNPCGAAGRASAADSGARILGLLRSMPPVRVAPSREGSGRSSRKPSVMKAMSAQSSVDDLGEVVDAAAAAQLPGVVHGGLEAQDVLALGVGLALEQPEADAEPGQAVLGVLDHDLLRGRAGRPVVMRPVVQAEQGLR